MITNCTLYEGAFINTETTPEPANENVQKIFTVRLFDTETEVSTPPYNFRFIVSNNGDGTQTVSVFSDPFTDPLAEIYFGYDNAGWIDTALNLNGRTAITIPQGDWDYSVLIASDSGAPRYEFEPAETIDLEMGETPILISVVDNAEDKFTPIKSKQVEIQIHSNDAVGIETFAEGGDNRFYVEIESETDGVIFKGWLSTSDLSQDFLPDPNVLTLIATDGLGFLEDEPLLNFEDVTPQDRHQIIDFLVWALGKTGLMLDVKVCMNIRESTAVPIVSDADGSGHFYKFVYLDAKTFEKEIATCEDCRTVLEKILGENAFLTQYRGKWLIIRPDEMETGHEYYFTRFNYLGDFVENTDETFSKNIGVGLPLAFMNDDATLSLDRPYKQIIERFNYDYPKEIICNIDYSQGEFVEDMPDEVNADGVTEQVKKYTLPCWAHLSRTVDLPYWENFGQGPLPSSNVYVKRYYFNGTETQRIVVIQSPPGAAPPMTYIQSTPMELQIGDKISLQVSLYYTNIGANTGSNNWPVYVGLFADDGDIYWWQNYNVTTPEVQPLWGLTPPNVLIYPWYKDALLENPPLDMQFTSPPLPKSGRVYVFLSNEYGEEIEANFGQPKIDIIPFVNGGYNSYKAQTNDVSQDAPKIKAIRETDVYISDAPRIAMKGALLKPGAGFEIFSGTASFGTLGQFEISGNIVGLFPVGILISITGSGSNNITGRIIDNNYSIIGDLTTIYTDQTTVSELGASITVTEATYQLTGDFYNAALATAGGGTPYTFGRLQSFDIWNQFNRVMRTFEATIDRTDSATQLPDLLHKYILRDIDANTTNGSTQYRIFMLLHYEMNLHLCEWAAFLHEVFNTDVAKSYETAAFKYITE